MLVPARSLYSSPLDPLASSAPDLFSLKIQISQQIHAHGYAVRIKQAPTEGNSFKCAFECPRGFDCPFWKKFRRTGLGEEGDGDWWEVTGIEPDHSHPPTELGEWMPTIQLEARMRQAGWWTNEVDSTGDQAGDRSPEPQSLRRPSDSTPHSLGQSSSVPETPRMSEP